MEEYLLSCITLASSSYSGRFPEVGSARLNRNLHRSRFLAMSGVRLGGFHIMM